MAKSDPLKRLIAKLSLRGSRFPLLIVGTLSALFPPALLLILGFFIEVISRKHGLQDSGASLSLGPYLNVSQRYIGSFNDLQIVLGLVAGGVVLAVAYALLLSLYYRLAYRFAVDAAVRCYEQAALKNEELAISRGVSGQNLSLLKWFESHIPSIRTSLFAWEKAWPRLMVQAILFLAIAALMNFWVTAVALISLLLLGQFLSWLSHRQKANVPLLFEKVWQHEQRLAEVCRNIALLSTVRSKSAAYTLMQEEVRQFRSVATALAVSQSWRTPLMIFCTAIVIGVFCLVLGIQLIDRQPEFDLAAALTLGLAVCGVAFSLSRLVRQRSTLPQARNAAQEILTFLDTPVPVPLTNGTQHQSPLTLKNRILIEHVTLEDSTGRRLLQDVSLELVPKKVVAIVSSRAVESKTLAELLLGFGRPLSGRMLFDESLVTDIDPEEFPQKCIWVSATGPLLHGTIEENLRSSHKQTDMVDLTDAVRMVNAYDAIQQYENGLSTIVSSDDERLSADLRYRLGLARALLKSPALVVAEEPDEPVSSDIESESTDAIRNLAAAGPLVLVLPKRLSTLRLADEVILIHDNTIVMTGTHADLIQQSELYRHLTYVRFSPLRLIGV